MSRSRELIARGRQPAAVARVLQVNWSGLYRPPLDPVDQLIAWVARENPTDGTRMVAALASCELGRQVNRKRVQRVMRIERRLQRHRPLPHRRRPRYPSRGSLTLSTDNGSALTSSRFPTRLDEFDVLEHHPDRPLPELRRGNASILSS